MVSLLTKFRQSPKNSVGPHPKFDVLVIRVHRVEELLEQSREEYLIEYVEELHRNLRRTPKKPSGKNNLWKSIRNLQGISEKNIRENHMDQEGILETFI